MIEEESENQIYFSSLTQFLNNFTNSVKIGEGTYGVVYRMEDRRRNRIVAVKKIKLENQDDEGLPSTSLREIAILKMLKHPSIVELLDVKYSVLEKRLFMVFEYIDFDLKIFLDKRFKDYQLTNPGGPLKMIEIKKIIYQILQGLCYIHANGVLHRDLKPQNILVGQLGQIKIADFGLSRIFSFPLSKFTKEIATLWYRAPELMLGDDSYGTGIDIWAVGCIMAEMLTNQPLFMGDSQVDMLFKMMQLLGTPNDISYNGFSKMPEFMLTFPKFQKIPLNVAFSQLTTDQGVDFIDKMLQFYPGDRWEAKQLLAHPWLKEARI